MITCLFIDIGVVLLSNAWDHNLRKLAATDFKLDWDEMEARHQLNVNIYEQDKFARAIRPALEIWQGEELNVEKRSRLCIIEPNATKPLSPWRIHYGDGTGLPI